MSERRAALASGPVVAHDSERRRMRGTKSVLARASSELVPDIGTKSALARARGDLVPEAGTNSMFARASRKLVPLSA